MISLEGAAMSFGHAIAAAAFLCSIVIAFSLPAQENVHSEHGEAPAAVESGAHSEGTEHDPHGSDREWIQNEDIILAPRFSLVPTVNLEFVNHERVWVYGFNFAYKF